MASQAPTIRSSINWMFLIPQLLFIVLLIYLFTMINPEFGSLFAAITYIILGFVLKRLNAKDHHEGMKLLRAGRFEEALPCFQRSIDYFKNNEWVDKYRCITMLSAGNMSYYEISLCNYAFCLSQTNRGEEAKALYEDILKQYPSNVLAASALRMLNSY